MIKVSVLPASHGDCILLSIGTTHTHCNILVDGGTGKDCFINLKKVINNLKQVNQSIDLLVVTHVDDDHISGIIRIFKDPSVDKRIIKRVWFNSGNILARYFGHEPQKDRDLPIKLLEDKDMSIKQGITFEQLLEDLNCWDKSLIKAVDKYEINGIEITVLSPDIASLKRLNDSWEKEINANLAMSSDKSDHEECMDNLLINNFIEDQSIPNRGSIAFLLEYSGKKALFLGDSHPSVVISSLKQLGYGNENPLSVDLIKISHHGSKGNTSPELLKMLKCYNFIISSNGGRHNLPDKECLARIVAGQQEHVKLYFNYKNVGKFFTDAEFRKYNFSCNYDLNQEGYSMVEVT